MLVIDQGKSEAEEKHLRVHSQPAILSRKTCSQEGSPPPTPGPLSPGPHSQVSLPGNHIGGKAHKEGPYEGADLFGGTLSPPLLFLQTPLPHTAQDREKIIHGVAWPGHRELLLADSNNGF